MLLSRNSHSDGSSDYKMLKNAGWQAIDINETCMGNKFLEGKEKGIAYIKGVIDRITEAGLLVGQCHAPMTNTYEGLSEEQIENVILSVVNCTEAASELNIPCTIVHPFIYSWSVEDPDPEKTRELNVKYLKRVVEKAENTLVCLENLPGIRGFIRTAEDLEKMCKEVSEKLFVCLDTGHAFSNRLKTSEFFEVLGDRIKALHVHDSFNGMDVHMLPYVGSGDWNDFKQSIKRYNYTGTLNSEVNFTSKLPSESILEWEIFERKVLETLL